MWKVEAVLTEVAFRQAGVKDVRHAVHPALKETVVEATAEVDVVVVLKRYLNLLWRRQPVTETSIVATELV